jgi:hypothetical protein
MLICVVIGGLFLFSFFFLFRLAIVLFVLLRIDVSDYPFRIFKETFEDSKGVIRIRKSKNTTADRRRTKGQNMIYKTLHRKIKIEQHAPH